MFHIDLCLMLPPSLGLCHTGHLLGVLQRNWHNQIFVFIRIVVTDFLSGIFELTIVVYGNSHTGHKTVGLRKNLPAALVVETPSLHTEFYTAFVADAGHKEVIVLLETGNILNLGLQGTLANLVEILHCLVEFTHFAICFCRIEIELCKTEEYPVGSGLAVAAAGAPEIALGILALIVTCAGTRCLLRDHIIETIAAADESLNDVRLSTVAGDTIVASVVNDIVVETGVTVCLGVSAGSFAVADSSCLGSNGNFGTGVIVVGNGQCTVGHFEAVNEFLCR